MSLDFYIDHHVHAGIVRGLRTRGINCLTAREDSAQQLDDEDLLARATLLARIMFSQDHDMPAIGSAWIASGREFAGIVHAPQLGITVGQAIRDLELIAQVMSPEEMKNTILWIPL